MFLKHVSEIASVEQIDDACVVTLPVLTLDNRLVDVFVEQRAKDYFLIHDACKAMNELILQGVKITPSIEASFALIASNFQVGWDAEMFQAGCKIDKLNSRIMAVGACSAMAMHNLLGHAASDIEEHSLHDQVGDALKKWGKANSTIKQHVTVNGAIKQHSFDFVAYPRAGRMEPIAISVISPTAGSLSAAERFGFKVKDLESTVFGKWRNVAVESRGEVWSNEAQKIIHRCADAVINIESGGKPTQSDISEAISRMAVA